MNQILTTTKNNVYISDNIKNKNKTIYFIIFIISIIICIILTLYLFYIFILRIHKIKHTNILKEKYKITSLYSNNTFSILKLSNEISVIGLIEIPKLNISYPILSESKENFLKISVCRFSGPLPNRKGNLCIAGHNYKNNLMFSNLNKLNINDSIYITDLNNTKLEYIVYDKFKIKQNNLDCTLDRNIVEITLITCNNTNNSFRTIIKAKVKG